MTQGRGIPKKAYVQEKTYREGILGKKLGMTGIFLDSGNLVPVTVLQAGPCYVLDVKEENKSGYSAVQIGFEPKKAQRVDRALTGHFSKAGRGSFYHVREVRCDIEKLGWNEPGKEIVLGDLFEEGQFVDVTGTSLGKGFSGVFRRYGMSGQPSTRGTHEARRNVGSIGCRKSPGRVWKNRRLPGHQGASRVTVQNLKIMGVRPEDNIILVKGAVPGPKGGVVEIRRAVKKEMPQKAAA